MLCESCGEREASVKLTQIVNDKVRKLNLCEECAVKSGLIDSLDLGQDVSSLADVLLGMGMESGEKNEETASGKSCARCGTTHAVFQQTSRLGCSDCYETFSEELVSLLDGMQKGRSHVGKVPARYSSGAVREKEVSVLRESLKNAVDSENYEEAARLRDCIKRIENAGKGEPEKENSGCG